MENFRESPRRARHFNRRLTSYLVVSRRSGMKIGTSNFISLFLTAALTGCFFADKSTKIVLGDSSTSVYQTADTHFSRYKTFSVFPFDRTAAVVSDKSLDASLLFFLRNQMESKGYAFVNQNKNPDLWITQTLYPSSEQTPSIPIVFARPTVSTASTTNTDVGWGNYLTGSSVFTANSAPTEFHPKALVVAYDGKTSGELWHGIGQSDSDNPDARISGQDAITAALANFPTRQQKQQPTESYGAIGVRLQIYSTDGHSYLPMVVEFAKISPARDVGMKEKDCIISVDSQSLANQTFSDANQIIRGRPDSVVTLEVLRKDQPFSFTMKRLPWSGVWGSLDPN